MTFNDIAMTFCWCPAGTITMGSPDSEADRVENERQFEVTLTRGFWMGKYEVTQVQYEQVMGTRPSHLYGDQLPVDQVSWDDAAEFCRKLTEMERNAGRLSRGWEYRLPTEAQWEYACRAGTTTAYCFGEDQEQLGDYAWYIENSSKHPHEVGGKKSQAWGLHDMHGNIWECPRQS
jgi:formylglycine-generating enzyme required for sulfatase activity